jgi:hypothetical protein
VLCVDVYYSFDNFKSSLLPNRRFIESPEILTSLSERAVNHFIENKSYISYSFSIFPRFSNSGII